MNAKVVLFIFALLALVLAQEREDKFLIDPFSPDTDPLVITITATTSFPVVLSDFTQAPEILGGERDLQLTANAGPNGRTLSASVSSGQWEVSTPNAGRGFSAMQYDGLDASSDLDPNGLGGVNFQQNGGDALRARIETDIDTLYTFTVIDSAGGQSSQEVTIIGGNGLNDYFLPFSEFTGSADFSRVGAFYVEIEAFDNVDTFVDLIGVSGPPVSNPSPSPRPVGDDWYTFDDDDNGVSPCTTNEKRRTYFLSDNELIYYYFYGAFQGTNGFEDDFDAASANSAAVAVVSVVLSLVAAFVAQDRKSVV